MKYLGNEKKKEMKRELGKLIVKLRSRRGSEMMEAALVFPIVIMAAMGLLYLTIGMYDEASVLTREQLSDSKQEEYDEMGYIRWLDAGKRGLQQYSSY